MSKKIEDTELSEPEILPTVEVLTNNTLLQENYEAMEYLSWFGVDAKNVQNWAGIIFKGGFDKEDPKMSGLLSAATKSLAEIEDDVANIKAFLAEYVPVNQ